MAGTGATNFADAADKIAVDLPYISRVALEQLREMDQLVPHLFDAVAGYREDGTNYPGGASATFRRLDYAVLAAIMIVNKKGARHG